MTTVVVFDPQPAFVERLDKVLAGDESIPAGRVRNEAMSIVADRAAHPS